MSNCFFSGQRSVIGRKPKRHYFNRYPRSASPAHYERLNEVRELIFQYRGKKLLTKVEEKGLHPRDARIYKSGGVGTYQWLPKLRCFRLQLESSHINRRGFYMPYATCVDIY